MTPLLKPNPESDTSASQPETSRAGQTTAGFTEAAPQEADPSFGPPATAGELGRLGHYRVLRVLGRGGMGAIYLATDEQLGREVALKVMLPEAAAVPTARERFLREARAAAGIDHDHVVAIHHVGEESGVPYIVMPLLKGETLADRLHRDGRLTAAEATRVGRETALGLAAAHARGLVHRDVKPANIWLEAGSGRVKVLDFGLARPDDTEQQQLTNTGAVMGTPAYMAPEQAAGETIDSRADLFSLGCVMYEAATGRRPFAAPTVMGVLTKIATHTPPPASTIADVPPSLSDLIAQLLAKQPAGRPQTAAGVAVLLNVPAASPNSEVTTTFTPAPPRKPRRWAWVAAAGMSGVMAVAFAGVTVLKIQRDDGTETTVEVPDGASAKVDTKGNVVIALPKAAPKPVAPVGAVTPPPDIGKVAPVAPPVTRSPLDALDPAKVPAADRVPGLGDAQVAAFGSGERAHWGHLRDGAYSPDGKTVATAGYEGVRLWDARTLAPKGFVPGWASSVEFSPDGKTLAVCLYDWKSCLVDVSGKEPRVTHTLDGVFNRGAFSPDGRRLHVAHPFAAYDLSGPAPKKVLTAPEGLEEYEFLYRLADGRFLSWAIAAKRFAAWDLTGDKPVKGWELTPPDGLELRAHAATVTPDGKTLLCFVGLGNATALGIWDVGGKGPALVGTHPVADLVGYLAATPDSARVYLHVNGQPIQVYDRAVKTLTATALHATVPLAVSPDGKSLLTASDGSRVGVADGLPNALTPRFPPVAAANAVGVTADNKWFVEMVGERLVTWRVGELRPAAGAGLDGCRGYCVNPRGPGVAVVRSLGDKSVAEGFDPARPGVPLFRLPVPGWSPVSYNGDRVALAADGDKAVEVWSVAPGTPPAVVAKVAVPDGWGVHPKLSPDNRYLAINEGGARTAVWRLGGKTPERLPDMQTWRVEFLTGDRAVVVHEGAATVTDLLGKVGVRHLHGPESLATFAAGPGDAVAVAYDDGSVWLWDAASVTVTRKFHLPGAARALEFAPDGRHLITTNANGTASVLRLEPPPFATK